MTLARCLLPLLAGEQTENMLSARIGSLKRHFVHLDSRTRLHQRPRSGHHSPHPITTTRRLRAGINWPCVRSRGSFGTAHTPSVASSAGANTGIPRQSAFAVPAVEHDLEIAAASVFASNHPTSAAAGPWFALRPPAAIRRATCCAAESLLGCTAIGSRCSGCTSRRSYRGQVAAAVGEEWQRRGETARW